MLILILWKSDQLPLSGWHSTIVIVVNVITFWIYVCAYGTDVKAYDSNFKSKCGRAEKIIVCHFHSHWKPTSLHYLPLSAVAVAQGVIGKSELIVSRGERVAWFFLGNSFYVGTMVNGYSSYGTGLYKWAEIGACLAEKRNVISWKIIMTIL